MSAFQDLRVLGHAFGLIVNGRKTDEFGYGLLHIWTMFVWIRDISFYISYFSLVWQVVFFCKGTLPQIVPRLPCPIYPQCGIFVTGLYDCLMPCHLSVSVSTVRTANVLHNVKLCDVHQAL
ncbi:hypothetical protein DPEC_G00123640 [Dallia pectoralis]|uniref:Uncharacterized protein n=1 Tax=Dallia pectoralis TaxID=75939 RepID=A0ACC2GR09_DALPE|nr:hypothetical protein DPEC_G00123640 [Dallia pectoralis]